MAIIRHRMSFLSLALLAAGCASTPEVRNLAARTGVFVTSMERGTDDFMAAQNRLNAENEQHLRTLAARGDALKARAAQQRIASTRAGATTLLESRSAATSVTGADIIAQVHPREIQPAAISFESDGYGKAASGLVEIGRKPGAMALLRSLAAFGGTVVGDVHAGLVEKAKNSAAATAGETAAAAGQAVTAGAAAAENEKEQ
jgi:hypothetical protein